MALIRTDYGLIYNTDGSLCATLLPEGGVAVTEGTTNLCDPAYMYTNTWTTIDYGWDRRTIIDCTAGDIISISADIRNLSQGANQRWGQVSFRDSGGIELTNHNAWDSGMSEQRLSFTTPAAPMGTVEARVYWASSVDGVTYQGKNFQIEKKPFATPFVEGTRPAGILPYPELAKQFNQREFTFVAEWRPYSPVGTQLERIFHVDNGIADHGNMVRFMRDNNSRRLYLQIPNVDGTDTQTFGSPSIEYSAYEWQFVAAVLDVPNMKARIHLNDEYREFVLTEVPALLNLQHFFLGCVGTSGQLNGELKNVQIINEALPIEVINNF